MAKKPIGKVKLALSAGKATPSPPVGPALGSFGVNLAAFCKQYNDQTSSMTNTIVPADITIYDDRSFTFVLKTPPTSLLIVQALSVRKGSPNSKQSIAGTLTQEQLEEIARQKLPDLNTENIDVAKKIVSGTARNMGVSIVPLEEAGRS